MASRQNTKQQGDVGVAMAIAYYTKNRFVVSVPLTDNSKYDLVVDKEGVLRVQCKTSKFQPRGKSFEVALRTKGGNQSWSGTYGKISSEDTDLLFVYTFDGRLWELPVSVVEGKSTISLGKMYDKYEVFL